MTSSPAFPPVLGLEDILPIVDAVVAQLGRHLPAHVSTEDLASAGKLALVEVLHDFNGSFAQDRGYVVCRVRGAVWDEMRRLDPLSRYGRAQVRALQASAVALEAELNRAPSDRELGEAVGLVEQDVRKIQRLAAAAEALSTDALEGNGLHLRSLPDTNAPSPADSAEANDSASAVHDALARLTQAQALVLQRYYYQGSTLQEIALELGISVVRVHQLRTAAETRLRGDPVLLRAWTGAA